MSDTPPKRPKLAPAQRLKLIAICCMGVVLATIALALAVAVLTSG